MGLKSDFPLVETGVVAVVDPKRTGRQSVYHANCELLLPPTTELVRCSSCSKHRNSLRAILCRSKKKTKGDRTHPSSHTNYTALDTPEKEERLHRLRMEMKNARQKLDRLREKIS